MASFEDHIDQTSRNLKFFQEINTKSDFFDWQVTVLYYSAIHLMNAHIAKVGNLHYQSHSELKKALNPHYSLSIGKIPEQIFDDYISLEKLSRRARYLSNEKTNGQDGSKTFLTFEKHVSKAIQKLNSILLHFCSIYPSLKFETTQLNCPKVKRELKKSLEYFVV